MGGMVWVLLALARLDAVLDLQQRERVLGELVTVAEEWYVYCRVG